LPAFQSILRADAIMHDNSKDLTVEQTGEVTAYLTML
jgi:hypothetical protein